MQACLKHILVLILTLGAVQAYAQGEDAKASVSNDALYEFGFHLGNLLPNQINGVSEIMGLGGARAGYRLSPGTYAEAGMIMGNGEGVQWKNAHIDMRMDVPIENIVGIALVGFDANYYKGNGMSATKLIFGGHVGGGVRIHVAGNTWFRTDMKFSFSPGTSLYFGFGFEWRMGAGGGS